MKKSIQTTSPSRVDTLYKKVSGYIDHARKNVQKTVDTEIVKAYWLIGRDIIEEEQHGEQRAEYGKSLLKNLAERLQKKYQRGFGVDTLEQARKFYLTYQVSNSQKSDALRRKSHLPHFHPNLSWTHYRELMRVIRPEAFMKQRQLKIIGHLGSLSDKLVVYCTIGYLKAETSKNY